MKIALDIGHGQDNRTTGVFDPGAVGSGVREYDEAKLTVSGVVPLLKAHGHDVFVIDGGRLTDRQTRAARYGAQLYVSFHLNAGGGTGTESYVRATPVATAVKLQDEIHSRLVKALGLRDRGKKRRDYAVITGSVPAVLLELVFIDKASDVSTLKAKRPAVCKAIADGILELAGRKAGYQPAIYAFHADTAARKDHLSKAASQANRVGNGFTSRGTTYAAYVASAAEADIFLKVARDRGILVRSRACPVIEGDIQAKLVEATHGMSPHAASAAALDNQLRAIVGRL